MKSFVLHARRDRLPHLIFRLAITIPICPPVVALIVAAIVETWQQSRKSAQRAL